MSYLVKCTDYTGVEVLHPFVHFSDARVGAETEVSTGRAACAEVLDFAGECIYSPEPVVPIMTGAEMSEYVGKTGMLRIGGMSVTVEIFRVKQRPDGKNFRVFPITGIGMTWVKLTDLTDIRSEAEIAEILSRHQL